MIDATAACLEAGAVCDVFEVTRDGVRVPFVAQARARGPTDPVAVLDGAARGHPHPSAPQRWGLWRSEPYQRVVRLDRWYAIGATPGRYEARWRSPMLPGTAPIASAPVAFELPGAPLPPEAPLDAIDALVSAMADPAARTDALASRLGRALPGPGGARDMAVLPRDPRFAEARVAASHLRPVPHPFTVTLGLDEDAALALAQLQARWGPGERTVPMPHEREARLAWYRAAGAARDPVAVFVRLDGPDAAPAARVREVMIRWDG